MTTAYHPQRLCAPCSALTFTMLRDGYTHPLVYRDTIKSGETCALCRLMACSIGKLSADLSAGLDWYKAAFQDHFLTFKSPELPAGSREGSTISEPSTVNESLNPLLELNWSKSQYDRDFENSWELRRGKFNDGDTIQITAPAGKEFSLLYDERFIILTYR